VLAVPGSTTGGTGRLRSWISHFVSTCALQTAGMHVSANAPTQSKIIFFIVKTSLAEAQAFYSR
jgi:hypothetical protein